MTAAFRQDICTSKHRRVNWAFGVFASVLALFVIVIGWTWSLADSARKDVRQVERAIDGVQAQLPYIVQGIRDIKAEQTRQRDLLVGRLRPERSE